MPVGPAAAAGSGKTRMPAVHCPVWPPQQQPDVQRPYNRLFDVPLCDPPLLYTLAPCCPVHTCVRPVTSAPLPLAPSLAHTTWNCTARRTLPGCC